MHASVRKYKFDVKNAAEIDRKVKDLFVPLIKKTPGFISYYWMHTGDGTGVSMSVFKDQGGTEESVRLAGEFVKKNLAGMVSKPEIVEGQVMANS